MTKKEKKTVIGWREYVDLPEWGIRGIRAKVDTGARTSSLHVEDVEELSGGRLSFYVVLNEKSRRRKHVVARSIKQGKVKSSIGIQTHRWFVQTKLVIGGHVYHTEFSLVAREGMNFRMLLGRKVLEYDFLVDVEHSFLLGKNKVKVGQR